MHSETNSLSQRWLARSNIFLTYIWMAAIAVTITWGWLNREQDYLSAENGIGYLLGIIGSSLMLLLLSYSLRKRIRALKRFFTVKFWFRLHMIFGVVGPLCILYHANFQLGSLNSTVAMICMLLVAGSGLAGRYLYTRIHYGLYGEKVRLQQVADDFSLLNKDLIELAKTAKQKDAVNKIFSAANSLLEQCKNNSNTFTLFLKRKQFQNLARSFQKLISHIEAHHQTAGSNPQQFSLLKAELHQKSAVLIAALKKLPGLQLSEKLFSLWHVVHIPIFILMILTAVTHVVVVHMY